MRISLNFTLQKDGQWKCPQCGWVFSAKELQFQNGRWACPKCALVFSPGRGTPKPPAPARGPGTELKKIFARFGFLPIKNCKCNQIAGEMDRRGPDWCRTNLDKLTDRIFQEAKKRKIPLTKFSRPAIKVFVRWAIKRAEQ